MRILRGFAKLGLFDLVDIIIGSMPHKTASSTMMAAVLRVTHRWQPSLIPFRKIMLKIVYDELKRRGENANEILIGLMEN